MSQQIKLKSFQQKAVEDISEKAINLVLKEMKDIGLIKTIVFESCTGSGKTIMAAKIIESILKEPSCNVSFVWISIGAGKLQDQSRTKIQKVLGQSFNVYSIDEIVNKSKLSKNDIVVVNWEKIRMKDQKTNDWNNIVMRKGEKTSFPEVIKSTETKIILLIDESHASANTLLATEIKNIINPELIIEMSATPILKNELDTISLSKGYHYHYKIKVEDVIAEGLIKDEFLVNAGLDLIKDDSLESKELILSTGFKKRDELGRTYNNANIKVNPLMLIQIPNKSEGSSLKEFVLNFLKKDRNIKDEEIAVWLSDDKTLNLESISDNTSAIKFLIFKEAIATGWDCPRAQVLVKFRESKSEIFDTQIVGRILRMPEQKHYQAIPSLNKSYIYTDVKILNVQGNHSLKQLTKTKQVQIKKDIPEISLNSFYKTREDYNDIKSDFYNVLIDAVKAKIDYQPGSYITNVKNLKKYDIFLDKDNFNQEISINVSKKSSEIIKQIDDGNDLSFHNNSDVKTQAIKFSDEFLVFEIDKELSSCLFGFAKARSLPLLRTQCLKLFKKEFGLECKDKIENIEIIAQRVLYNNINVIKPIIIDAVKDYKQKKQKKIETELLNENIIFKIPEVEFYNPDFKVEVTEYKKYMMELAILDADRSLCEKKFESFLERNEKVLYWFKNGQGRKEDFGISYFDPELSKIRTFYPDFIVVLSTGLIGLYEVKHENDRDGKGETKYKAETLQKYIKMENLKKQNETARLKLTGGIVFFESNSDQLKINNKDEYLFENQSQDSEDFVLYLDQ